MWVVFFLRFLSLLLDTCQLPLGRSHYATRAPNNHNSSQLPRETVRFARGRSLFITHTFSTQNNNNKQQCSAGFKSFVFWWPSPRRRWLLQRMMRPRVSSDGWCLMGWLFVLVVNALRGSWPNSIFNLFIQSQRQAPSV